MKELSVEEKAKLYDEAIEVAQRFYNNSVAITKKGLEDIFPELMESEDERIRKEMIEILKQEAKDFPSSIIAEKSNKWIAWLEKQGEKDLVTCPICGWEIKKQGEQKPSEWHREDEQNLNACLGYIPDEFLRRWLTDIIHVKYDKPGDKVEPKFKVKYAGSEYNVLDIKDIAGVTYYEIEDEPNHIDYVLPNHCKIVSEHKSFWSEEDERLRRKLIELIYAASYCDERENLSDWLKSLKDRYTWKPSDEQMKFLWKYAEQNNYDGSILTSLYNDLKKLRQE